MQTSLERIADKAKKQEKYRFRNLFRLINEEALLDAWRNLNKNAALGVDKVSFHEYEANLSENIRKLVTSLKEKRYKAKLIKRCYIPKLNGKMRPLGLPAIEDKLLQHAATQILQAIYEQYFLPCSFGYRPNRGCHDAVFSLSKELRESSYKWVVEADIKGFFDNIDHKWMVRMLEERIDDKAFVWLVRKWLRAGILDTDGKVIHPVLGTPQGGIISPVLANIYMHYVVALWFEKVFKPKCRGKAYLCIYADDFVTAFEYQSDAEQFYQVLGKRLGKFGLSLSEEKTKLLKFTWFEQKESRPFNFLGFKFGWTKSRKGKNWLKLTTAKDKLRNSLKTLKAWCKENMHAPLKELFRALNTKLRCYYAYYGVIGNLDGVETFFYWAMKILFQSLNQRGQEPSYTWQGFHDLLREFAIEKPRIVHKSSVPRCLS